MDSPLKNDVPVAKVLHKFTLETTYNGRTKLSRYRGKCACGWKTQWVGTAGLVHGEYGRHVYGEDY